MKPELAGNPAYSYSAIGATEDQVDMKDTVPQRVDREGTKIEDLAGTGEQGALGG
jgi:hypothetical protein